MAILGSLNGQGHVVIDGRKEGPFSYSLIVNQTDGTKSAAGELTGNMMPLYGTFGRDAVMELSQGKTINIVIDTVDAVGATFKVSGPVPGY